MSLSLSNTPQKVSDMHPAALSLLHSRSLSFTLSLSFFLSLALSLWLSLWLSLSLSLWLSVSGSLSGALRLFLIDSSHSLSTYTFWCLPTPHCSVTRHAGVIMLPCQSYYVTKFRETVRLFWAPKGEGDNHIIRSSRMGKAPQTTEIWRIHSI